MEFKIGNRMIGNKHPVYFIAEAGVNHNGSTDLAYKLIDAAKEAGADAVKFQTFKTESLSTVRAPKSTYHKETTGDDNEQSWFDLLKTQEMSLQMHKDLIAYCEKVGITFLSTPYDFESVDLLEEMGVPAYKLASCDITNIPLIKYIASKGKPLILSSGMTTIEEINRAISTLEESNLINYALLQCTANYPSPLEQSHLRVITTYKAMYDCVIGYSDHTEGHVNPIAAVAMGAKIYEKHYTLDRTLPGPDHRMSMEPNELKETIDFIRATESTMGNSIKQVLDVESENRIKMRKSLVFNNDLEEGQLLSEKDIGIKRPGSGMEPFLFDDVVGKKLSISVKKDDLICPETLI
ncbi:MAG: N-acetylneuraminate synthase [Bacteriovoracaceae bacterium]|jgi:N,N'-diacetyllegionaminate synthase|nr:N-acetylneuraminate synthase [Bacteriovoracaceae bacterium]